MNRIIDYRKLRDFITNHRVDGDELELGTPASLESIKIVEDRLGVKIPPSLKKFLSEVGDISDHEYYINGISGNDPLRRSKSLITDTMEAREQHSFSSKFIVVHSDENEYFVCLDTNKVDSLGECPVVEVDFITGHVKGELAKNFDIYLSAQIASFDSSIEADHFLLEQ